MHGLLDDSEHWDGVACVISCVCPVIGWLDCSDVCVSGVTHRLCKGTPAKGC